MIRGSRSLKAVVLLALAAQHPVHVGAQQVRPQGELAQHVQSQAEMNQEAAREFQKADKELNVVYKQLMAITEPEGRKELVTAQLAWIKFRDANAYARAYCNKGGSIWPLVYEGYRTRTTKERIAELKEMLKGDQR